MAEYIIDKLKERTTGKVLYPVTILESLKESDGENSKNLREILEKNGIPLDYELYGYAVNIADSNPQTRIYYFEMAKGKRPAFWNYTNGYFDEGDWSHAFFIDDMFPCMVKRDGNMDYKLDPYNYNLKEDGTDSDVTNTEYEGSAMVAIPTLWIKRWQDDNYLYCCICNKQLDQDYHAYMHTRPDGTIAKYKYISMYSPTLYTDYYKALSGTTVTSNKTFENELQYTHNIGENWEMFSVSDWAAINDLLTLISKSDNFQNSFGYGQVGNTAQGATVNTNTNAGKLYYGGGFYNSAALNTNSWQKVFHLHNLYSNHYTRMTGLIYNNGKMLTKPFPPYNATGEGYIDIGITLTGSSDTYCKISKMNQYGRFPAVLGGSAATYECDAVVYSNTGTSIACTRGLFNATTKSGKLGLHLGQTAAASTNIVPRLTCFSVDLTN